ncbi:glycosyltransferase family 4 protein [Sutcliffiella horikoshii]|uniref:glycosyltransferase family 4 protein n=1 Tax=Sutcliffiella horikoshii TaxID=79883 RepID=UPI00384FCE09
MSKRVLIITQNFYPEIGSAANRMKNIYQLLTEKGYKVKVLTTEATYPNKKIYEDEKFWDEESINKDEDIIRVKIKTRKYSRSIFNRLVYYLEIAIRMIFLVFTDKKKYETVLVTSPAIFVGFVGILAKFKYKAKLILDIRDLWPESLKGVGVFNYKFIIKLFEKFETVLYNSADEIVVNSKGFIKHIENCSVKNSNNIYFIPNSAKEQEIVSGIKKTNQFSVIYAGNIGLAQDYILLQELAKRLHKYQITLTIIGYGMNNGQLKQYVEELNLSNVVFMKPKTRKECLGIISKHNIGIVTLNDKKVFETVLPGKVIDYMTCGVPIVAAVSGIAKDIILKENVGFATDPGNIDEMMESILLIYKSEELSMDLSSNCNGFVRRNFLWEDNISTLEKII